MTSLQTLKLNKNHFLTVNTKTGKYVTCLLVLLSDKMENEIKETNKYTQFQIQSRRRS